MKIERKSKTIRREKKQRKSRLVKRVKSKANLKHYTATEIENLIEVKAEKTIKTNNDHNSDLSGNTFINKLKSSKSFAAKITATAALLVSVVVVSANITPIINYAFQDQNSALYPILKKYADDLRDTSNRLMVVTRRLNMLSILSEENELTNTTRINSLVLQINEMWFTTKKYLNFIGIETVAHTDLEREIEANSKVNDKGLIRETASKETIPENEITLTNVLKLDSIIQDLSIQINSVNNEINFLEDNAYASIKATHVYSHLLERSRNENGNYYATRAAQSYNSDLIVNNTPIVISPKKKVIFSRKITIEKTAPPIIKVERQKKQVVSPIEVATTKQIKVVKKVIIKQPAKLNKNQSKKIVVAKIKRNKIVGAFTVKEKSSAKSRKDKSNKLSNEQNITEKKNVIEEYGIPFDSPTFLDNVITDYAINFNEYEDPEESDGNAQEIIIIEEDDYSGG